MKKKLLLFLTMFMAFIFVLVGCTKNQSKDATKSEDQALVTYQIKEGSKVLDTKKEKVAKGSYVIKGLKKAWPIKMKKGMVTEIDGHKQDDAAKKYWVYTVNKKQVNKTVEQQKVKDKDKVIFTLKDFSK